MNTTGSRSRVAALGLLAFAVPPIACYGPDGITSPVVASEGRLRADPKQRRVAASRMGCCRPGRSVVRPAPDRAAGARWLTPQTGTGSSLRTRPARHRRSVDRSPRSRCSLAAPASASSRSTEGTHEPAERAACRRGRNGPSDHRRMDRRRRCHPGSPQGTVVVSMTGTTAVPYWGSADEKSHVVIKGLNSLSGGSYEMSTSGNALGTPLTMSGTFDMNACESITAASTHHIHDGWVNQDVFATSGDWAAPSSTSCAPSGCGPPPRLDLLPPSGGSQVQRSAADFADVLQGPSPLRTVGTCGGAGSGGGGSPAPPSGSAGGSVLQICYWLNTYDASGNLISSSLITCFIL